MGTFRLFILSVFSGFILIPCEGYKLRECTLNSILPFKIGATNFEVTNKINQMGIFEKKDDFGGMYYNMASTECYDGINNELSLKFINDRLYKYTITTNYQMNEYDRMISNYKTIVAKISLYPQYKIKERRYISNGDTQEQIGEGFQFKRTRDYGNKPDYIEVTYTIENVNNTNNKIYQIAVEFTNLNGTILTGDHY